MSGPPAVYSRSEQRAWYMYDWANSAFATTVVGVMMGPYLSSLARAAADARGFVYPLGIPVAAEALWGYTTSLSVLTQVLALPIFGAIADYGHRKREMLGVLAYLGAAATMAMFFLEGDRYLLGVGLFLLANFAFGASIVIYNSFLPEIAPAEERDSVSSKGWGLGYLGGGLLLALNLALYLYAARIGIAESTAVRMNLASAGVWWASFTIFPLRGIRNRVPQRTAPDGERAVSAALKQLAHTLSQVREYPQTMLFLLGFLIYNDAIQTVITMAVQFGADELKIPISTLTGAVLMVQFVAFLGAMGFNRIASRIGNKNTVILALLVWCGTLVYIYFGVYTTAQFFIAAAIIGVVMGGSQALSRSLYSFMIPKGQEAEYFSIYEISDKGTSWLGPLFFAAALQMTRSFRVAIISLILFFAVGIVVLARVDIRKAALEAGNEPPSRA